MSQRLQNFGPVQSGTIAMTTASSVGASWTQFSVPGGSPLQSLRVGNAGSGPCFVRFGKNAQTATTTGTRDHPLLIGNIEVWDIPAGCDNIAAILESGTGKLYWSIGEGS